MAIRARRIFRLTVMSLISKYARAIRDGIGKFARAIRERWSVLTVTILVIWLPVYAIAWVFDGFDNLVYKIAITVLITIWPFTKFTSPHEPLKVLSLEVWISVLSLMVLALVVGDRYDWRFISFSTILILAALPWCLVVGETIRRERMIIAGFAPTLIAIMVFLVLRVGRQR